tara:strand:+ start:76 stop:1761 length:1686 start_codon:yes stop_codon:yes gene_type:complete
MEKHNKILALKYRPQEFKDLIGQQVMVQTITNAIKLNKTPNAYLLTGIRGVGKTTTARLIAKALNCSKDFSKGEKCNTGEYCHCSEIINSNHMDILEIDAASKTGIDDVRELIENSKYSPSSAKYKIFIIDEVHMLSKQAFNGLLKTLEEPPKSLKFILATTEVRKIPVTILSRCQRFDLKRVSVEKIFTLLSKISKIENGKISDDALTLIARTSEGSVRDAVSLLDRALVSQSANDGKLIGEKDVREMLGLADRSKIINLFEKILNGKEKETLNLLREMINDGIDAKNFLNDILEILFVLSRRINLGPIEKDMNISETDIEMIDQVSKDIDMQDIGLFWQFTLKTIEDLSLIGNENLVLEMYVMQLIHLKSMGETNEITNHKKEIGDVFSKKKLTQNDTDKENLDLDLSSKIKDQLKNTNQIKTNPSKRPTSELIKGKIEVSSFKDLINLADKEKELELKYDLERNVKLVSFNKGKIDISFNDKLNKNFIKNLSEKLLDWTKERWVISLSKNDSAKSLYEQNEELHLNRLTEFKKDIIAKKIEKAFPDAKIIDIKEEKND